MRVHSPSYLSFVIINVVLNVEISDERGEGGREPGITDVCCKQTDGVASFCSAWSPLSAALGPRS